MNASSDSKDGDTGHAAKPSDSHYLELKTASAYEGYLRFLLRFCGNGIADKIMLAPNAKNNFILRLPSKRPLRTLPEQFSEDESRTIKAFSTALEQAKIPCPVKAYHDRFNYFFVFPEISQYQQQIADIAQKTFQAEINHESWEVTVSESKETPPLIVIIKKDQLSELHKLKLKFEIVKEDQNEIHIQFSPVDIQEKIRKDQIKIGHVVFLLICKLLSEKSISPQQARENIKIRLYEGLLQVEIHISLRTPFGNLLVAAGARSTGEKDFTIDRNVTYDLYELTYQGLAYLSFHLKEMHYSDLLLSTDSLHYLDTILIPLENHVQTQLMNGRLVIPTTSEALKRIINNTGTEADLRAVTTPLRVSAVTFLGAVNLQGQKSNNQNSHDQEPDHPPGSAP